MEYIGKIFPLKIQNLCLCSEFKQEFVQNKGRKPLQHWYNMELEYNCLLS